MGTLGLYFLYDDDFFKSLDTLTFIYGLDEENNDNHDENAVSKTETASEIVDPNLKAFLDEYESFIDDYIGFMNKYENSDDVVSMVSDYTKMLNNMVEYEKALSSYDEKICQKQIITII